MLSDGEWSVEREIVVPELDRVERHRLDRVATVRPVRVEMEVAAQCGADLLGLLGRWRALAGDVGEVLRCLPAQRLRDRLRCALADAGKAREATGVREPLQLVARHRPDDIGGPPKGLRLLTRVAHALQQLGDALERFDGLHLGHRANGTAGVEQPGRSTPDEAPLAATTSGGALSGTYTCSFGRDDRVAEGARLLSE